MAIDEWIFRIIGAILLLNVFSYGSYLFARGYYKNKHLNRRNRVTGYIYDGTTRFKPSVQWYWQGQVHVATWIDIIVLNKQETVKLFVNSSGTDPCLNIWSHNGKGQMITGIICCLIALLLMIVLI